MMLSDEEMSGSWFEVVIQANIILEAYISRGLDAEIMLILTLGIT